MTLNLNDSRWAKPALLLAGLLLAACVWASLAGGIFLVAFQQPVDQASPLTLYKYWFHYGDDPQVMKWLVIAMAAALVVLVLPLMFFLLKPSKKALFGSARFATARDIARAGLFGDKGIIVGKRDGKFLIFGGQQHVIISAPTRSGKGVGIVIPNLLSWSDSTVVLDIKQENWDKTSGFRRKHGQECYLFNPVATDYRTHRYNPLAYISEDANFRIDDTQKIGNMLFPDQPGTDPIWTATPRSLFLGIVLYLIETPGKLVTIGQVLRESLADGDGAAYFTQIINDRAGGKGGKPLSGPCVRGLNSYVSIAAETTRAGIMTGFRSRLELWMNPLVDAATSANDFDLRLVREKRMSIYIGVTPDNLDRMAPLINLFFQQLIDLNTRQLPEQNRNIKYACLLLMDEFTAIGKIPVLAKGISYLAGYWLRMLPIIQSPAQLVEVYGKEAAQTFTTNHALQIIFPPKASETDTARDISEWLGYETVKGYSRSIAKGVFAKKTPNETASDQKRALLLPQEITSLGKDKALIIMEDCPPILARKVRYYEDANFKNRLLPGAPVPVIDVAGHNELVSNDKHGKVTPAEMDMEALLAYADMRCREVGVLIED
ncbi:MAG: type IV secretory system conjugative DNA transfer family protein [Pseudomonadota bacterium]